MTFAVRTNDEILVRIQERKSIDFFGFELEDLVIRLPFSLAKEFLKEDAKEEDWEQSPRGYEFLKQEAINYLQFSWDKANDQRGISAARSMHHFMAWLWLMGDDLGELTEYQYYGKDQLVKICEHLGVDPSNYDDGVREN